MKNDSFFYWTNDFLEHTFYKMIFFTEQTIFKNDVSKNYRFFTERTIPLDELNLTKNVQ